MPLQELPSMKNPISLGQFYVHFILYIERNILRKQFDCLISDQFILFFAVGRELGQLRPNVPPLKLWQDAVETNSVICRYCLFFLVLIILEYEAILLLFLVKNIISNVFLGLWLAQERSCLPSSSSETYRGISLVHYCLLQTIQLQTICW